MPHQTLTKPIAKAINLALLSVTMLVMGAPCFANTQLAFPTAEGFGAYAQGGRGGDVYHVTNLNDSGYGSLRYGVQSASGPRTIVFDVAGRIHLQSRLLIDKPYLTLAGQTAPGAGITITGYDVMFDRTHDSIIRYLRFRPGDSECSSFKHDCLRIRYSTDMIVDHCSASWGIDENMDVSNYDESNPVNVTIQWSVISESLNDSCSSQGEHGRGMLLTVKSGAVTVHHNLFAHHEQRSPDINAGDDPDAVGPDVQLINNVIYDWGAAASRVWNNEPARVNYIGNYLIAGVETDYPDRGFSTKAPYLEVYQEGNLIDSDRDGIRDGVNTGWDMFGPYEYHTERSTPFDFPPVETDDAETAYERVLNSAGASIFRDEVDLRAVSDVINETGHIIDSQNEVGGYPIVPFAQRPAGYDTDQDGMPDDWELAWGFDPENPDDRNLDADRDGYTNLEEFLNGVCPYDEVLLGDVNFDGVIDSLDIDWVYDNRTGPGNTPLSPTDDIDGDGDCDTDDVYYLVEEVLGTFMGDANLDGIVDEADLSWVADGWKQHAGEDVYRWATGDFDGTGYIAETDLAYLADNWKQVPANTVPEPASLMMLIGLAGGLLPNRRRA